MPEKEIIHKPLNQAKQPKPDSDSNSTIATQTSVLALHLNQDHPQVRPAPARFMQPADLR